MLPCGICEESFLSNDALRVHLEGHELKEFQECEIKREQESDQEYDQHSDAESLILDCVKEEEQLQKGHLVIRTEEVFEESTSAQAEENDEECHTLHLRKSSLDSLNCSSCSFRTKNKQQFRVHMNVMHLNNFKCSHCPKRYHTKGYLIIHMKKEHEENGRLKLPEDELFRKPLKKKKKRERTFYECLKCTVQTKNRKTMYEHIRSVHRNLLDELYKAKGMVLDDDAGNHKCTKCCFKTPYSNTLRKHVKSVHNLAESLKLQKCSFCSYETKNKIALKNHLNAVHLKIRRFTCDLCQMKTSSKGHLRWHIERVHLKGNMIYICKKGSNCSFTALEKLELTRHIQRVHMKIQGFSCDFCGRWYRCSSGLASHKKKKHPTKEANRWTCDLCQETFNSRRSIMTHMWIAHLNSGRAITRGINRVIPPSIKFHSFLPEDVSFRITPEDQIRKGEKPTLCPTNSSSKSFMCSKDPKCSFETASKEKFEYHMNLMHSKRFKCFHCLSGFSIVSSFAAHIQKKHMTDERPLWPEDELIQISLTDQDNQKGILYDCLKCTVQKRDKLAIYQHIHSVHREHLDKLYKSKAIGLRKVHTGVSVPPSNLVPDMPEKSEAILVANARIYQKCTKCSYKTVNKQNLRNHVDTIHHKIRKFTCNLCQMKLSANYKLRRHIQTIHANEKMPYICKSGFNCFFRTSEKRELTKHIQRVHMKIQGLSCEFCGRWYRCSSGLAFHKKTKHPTKEANRFTCDLCKETFNSRISIMAHMRVTHIKPGRPLTRGINQLIP